MIVTETGNAPYLFEEEGALTGINIEILTKVMKKQELKVQLNPVTKEDIEMMMAKGRLDGIMGAKTSDELYDYSQPYYTSGYLLAVDSDAVMSDYADLRNHTIACVSDSAADACLTELSHQYDFDIRRVSDRFDLYKGMTEKSYDGIFDEAASLKYALKLKRFEGKLIGELQDPVDYALAVKKGENPELLETFNSGLKALKKKKYKKIMAHYE